MKEFNKDLLNHDLVIQIIIGKYVQTEKTLIKQLHFKTPHGPTIGGFREDVWKDMFEQIVPKKFVIEQSVFILDSEGGVSKEVDLAIFDETYTPYIFRYGRLKFLPIEAVAATIQCKSTSTTPGRLKAWVESISVLKTSNNCHTRLYNTIVIGQKTEEGRKLTQTATRPLRILCSLDEKSKNRRMKSGGYLFDVIIRALENKDRLEIEFDQKDNLQAWYLDLNHADTNKRNCINLAEELEYVKLNAYEVTNKEKPVSLLSFNLQLNQILMMVNNPILFPHKAYADLFNKFEKEGGPVDQ